MKITRNTEFETAPQYPGIGGYLLLGIEDLRQLVKETEAYGDSSMVKVVIDVEEAMTVLKFTVVDDGTRVAPKPATRTPRTPKAKVTPRRRGTASRSLGGVVDF